MLDFCLGVFPFYVSYSSVLDINWHSGKRKRENILCRNLILFEHGEKIIMN